MTAIFTIVRGRTSLQTRAFTCTLYHSRNKALSTHRRAIHLSTLFRLRKPSTARKHQYIRYPPTSFRTSVRTSVARRLSTYAWYSSITRRLTSGQVTVLLPYAPCTLHIAPVTSTNAFRRTIHTACRRRKKR